MSNEVPALGQEWEGQPSGVIWKQLVVLGLNFMSCEDVSFVEILICTSALDSFINSAFWG